MPYAHSGPEWVEITGDPASRVLPGVGPGGDDVSVPHGWAEAQDEAALGAFGVKEIGEPDPPPPGYRVTGSVIVDEDGAPVRSWVLEEVPLAEVVAEQLALIDAERDRRQRLDLVYDFGATLALDDLGAEIEAGERALQMRELDQDNWTRLHALALAAVLGGAPETILPMRAEDNWNVQTTAAQVLAVFAAGAARNAALLFYAGALKTQVRGAADAAAARAVLPAAAWPA